MRTTMILAAALLLASCDTLNSYGVGGEPLLYCRAGQAVIDDRIVGPDQARLAVVRRFKDGDGLCGKPGGALGADLDAGDAEVAGTDLEGSWRL